jgi:hypothetical protein
MFDISSELSREQVLPRNAIIGMDGLWGYRNEDDRPSNREFQTYAIKTPVGVDVTLGDALNHLWRQYENDCRENNEYPRTTYFAESTHFHPAEDCEYVIGTIYLGT